MKKAINVIRLAIKYGAYVMVFVDILEYAVDKIESIKEKPAKESKNE